MLQGHQTQIFVFNFAHVHTDGCENVTIPIFILTLALQQDILSENVAVMTPHNHSPIRGGHSSNFFRKNDLWRS